MQSTGPQPTITSIVASHGRNFNADSFSPEGVKNQKKISIRITRFHRSSDTKIKKPTQERTDISVLTKKTMLPILFDYNMTKYRGEVLSPWLRESYHDIEEIYILISLLARVQKKWTNTFNTFYSNDPLVVTRNRKTKAPTDGRTSSFLLRKQCSVSS